MGIEYTLANHKNKTCYELGKGSWYALCDKNRKGDACLLYEDSIYDVLINKVWEHIIENPTEGDSAESWQLYAKEIAGEIFKFVDGVDPSQISLTNDCDDSSFELRERGYRWVGSRYREEDLSALNRHIK